MSTKTKWKCSTCGKTLASKQTAVNHVEKFHPESDPKEIISKVTVEISEQEGQRKVPKYKIRLSNIFPNYQTFSMMMPCLKSFL